MSRAVLEATLIDIAVPEDVLAFTVEHLVHLPVSSVLIAISESHLTFALSTTIHQLSFVDVSRVVAQHSIRAYFIAQAIKVRSIL